MNNTILQWLAEGDLRTDGMANEVVEIVLQNPELITDLFSGLQAADEATRGHTADALEKVSRDQPEICLPYLALIRERAANDPVAMVRWHLAMVLTNLARYPDHIEEITGTLLNLLDDDSTFVRSWAISGLTIIGRNYPNKQCDILQAVALLGQNESAAIRIRVRKAVECLLDPKKPLPKGWVKSRFL
jgi:HEAT repeat protein